MNINEIAKSRYAVKAFDKNKKINEEDISKLEELLSLSPSSTNTQPWSFIIAESDEAKKKITKSTESFGFNTQKVLNASHVVIFNVKYPLTDEHLKNVLEKEDQDGRFIDEAAKAGMDSGRRGWVKEHEADLKDEKHWLEKQVYLNVGHFVISAKALGIDSVVMEGFDRKVLDSEFDLEKKNESSLILVGIGYPSDDDFNKDLPKSRLDIKDIVTRV